MIPGCPSLSDEARGVLRFLWRKSHVKDNWAKGGEISDAWDRWSIFPWYMYPLGARSPSRTIVHVDAKIAEQHLLARPAAPIDPPMLQRDTEMISAADGRGKGFDPTAAITPITATTRRCRRDGRAFYAPGHDGVALATRRAQASACHPTPAVQLTVGLDDVPGRPDRRQRAGPIMGKALAEHHIACILNFVCGRPAMQLIDVAINDKCSSIRRICARKSTTN